MTFVNMSDTPMEINFDWNKHDIGDDVNGKRMDLKNNTFKIRDLFNHKNLGDTSKNLIQKLNSHDVLMIQLNKI